MPRIVPKWELTPEALARLMARLDADPVAAGEKYEHLRRALVKFFQWNNAAEPDSCADDTLDRLARRLDSGQTIDDVPSFARGVARLIVLERRRQAGAKPVVVDPTAVERIAAPPAEPVDEQFEHLQACLETLSATDRALIVRYYVGEGREKSVQRAAMARELGVSDNALRRRTQRLRDQLRSCAERRQHGSSVFHTND